MNISKKNINIGIAAALVASLACAGGAASLVAHAAELTRATASLFLPSSYEQYLELNAPKDIAIDDENIAIADGNHIYLCDRTQQEWRTYTNGIDHATFGKIQFANGILYFTDAAMKLHSLDPNAQEFDVKDLSYNLANFIIAENQIYGTTTMTMTTSLYSLSLDGSTEIPETQPLVSNLPAQLPMTYADGKLYYAVNNSIFPIDIETHQAGTCFSLSTSNVVNANSIAFLDGYIYYTDTTGFYRANTDPTINDHVPETIITGEGFSALTVFNEKIYVLAKDAVREFDSDTMSFTSFEIASSSPSVNRLSGAVDTARAGDLLVTADAGNKRVSVCDFSTGKYFAIGCPDGDFSPEIVATDGSVIAVVSGKTIYSCTYTGKDGMQFEAACEPAQNAIHGLACVYGEIYYVTGNAYGKVGGETVFHDIYGSPAALASDVYGDLFVVYEASREVVRFTEKEFCDAKAAGEKLSFTLPEDFACLRADYEGNLYYLCDGTLLRNDSEEVATVRGSDYVYTMSEDGPSAFALGYEDDTVYFLFGDYIVASARGALDIPTLDEIDAEGVYEQVFAPHGKENLFVDIPAETIGIRTDLSALREEDPACFPYAFYFRMQEDARGVLLAEKNGFALVVLYEIGETERDFTASLFRIDPEQDGLLVDESEYWTEGESTRYLTSDVSAYFYPCLPSALADARLLRGSRVKVLGAVRTIDQHDYALVEYETPAREVARGYVPVDYLTDIDPEYTGQEQFLFATLKKAGSEGYPFVSEDGEILTLHGGERVRLEDMGDGSYLARYTAEDGKTYSAVVAKKNLDWGENDALRISLIVILSVTAVLIVGLYVWFLPRKPKGSKK